MLQITKNLGPLMGVGVSADGTYYKVAFSPTHRHDLDLPFRAWSAAARFGFDEAREHGFEGFTIYKCWIHGITTIEYFMMTPAGESSLRRVLAMRKRLERIRSCE